jgi:hypothetical protein
MKYYFLVSYFPEIHRDEKKLRLRLSDLLAERSHFSEGDWAQIELLLLAGDVLQIEKLLAGKDIEVEYTLFGREFWREQIKSPKEVPGYFAEVFDLFASEGLTSKNIERLYETYYDYVIDQTSSSFLRIYFSFEKDLRNILAAIRARRKGVSPSDYIVGGGDLIDALSRSSAEDFGLMNEYPWIERLLAAKDPVSLEESNQQIIWETLDEMTQHMDFEFDVILAYLLKLHLLERNLVLSEERGMDVVRQLEGL